MSEPKHRFLYRRRVEFADTDTAGIMHFSNFFRFMEVTEHAFLRSLGLSVHPADTASEPQVGWPRVHASADYRLPLRFEEEVEVELLIEKIDSRTMTYFFQFWKNPDEEEARALSATGRITVVCVNIHPDTGDMKAVAVPPEFSNLIEIAPSELLNGA